jgi:hypothetical protein
VYRHVHITKVNDEANEKYLARQYGGRITLFRPRNHFIGFKDQHFGWRGIPREGLEVQTLPCYPRAMLVQPFVRLLATSLEKCIKEGIERSGMFEL